MARLVISVSFLTGRYHGREWPPSPMRLFQALLAGAMNSGDKDGALRLGLAWLERQTPPEIVSRPARRLKEYRISVPNNDFDVAAKEIALGKDPDTSNLRTMKRVAGLEVGESGPQVYYVWSFDDCGENELEGLRKAVLLLHTLGWGVDMAFADSRLDLGTENRRGEDRWLPADGGRGEDLAIPIAGTLADLEQTYLRYTQRSAGKGVDPDTRPRVYALQRYRRESDGWRPYSGFTLESIAGERAYSRWWNDAMVVAAWMRHAAGEALRGEVSNHVLNGFVLGHPEEGRPSERLSYVPVPSIGHPNSDGKIRRAMVVGPMNGDLEVLSYLEKKLPGKVLEEVGTGRKMCRVGLSETNEVVWPFYSGWGKEWHSVTPVVLHGFNSDHGKLSLKKTERLLLEAFAESGYPEGMLASYTIQSAPLWAGCGGAGTIRMPLHLAKWPRYHMTVRFCVDVRGPVVVGIGRHSGIGVFARVGS